MRSLAATLAPDDQSLDAIYVRSANVGWREWEAANIVRTRLQHQWATLFGNGTSCSARRCRRQRSSTIVPSRTPAASTSTARPWPTTTTSSAPAPATAAGLPATVAPIGRTDTGLPIGVQIIGPHLEDLTPIQFAQLVEQAFGGFVPPVL